MVCPSPKWMTMIRICWQLLDNNFVCLFVCRPYLSAYIHTYTCVCFGLIENLHKINFNWKSCLGQFRKLSEQLTRSLTHSLHSLIQSLANWSQTNIGICLSAKIFDKITNSHGSHIHDLHVYPPVCQPYLFMLPENLGIKNWIKASSLPQDPFDFASSGSWQLAKFHYLIYT